jgi:hypothetical protein
MVEGKHVLLIIYDLIRILKGKFRVRYVRADVNSNRGGFPEHRNHLRLMSMGDHTYVPAGNIPYIPN